MCNLLDISIVEDSVDINEYKYYNYTFSNVNSSEIKKVKVDCVIKNLTLFPMRDVCMKFDDKVELPKFICGDKFDTQLATPLLINQLEEKKFHFIFS